MNEPIRPDFGAPPWAPSSAVSPVEILDRYDRPLAGLLSDSVGDLHLFTCIAGRTDSWNLWTFTPVTEETAIALRKPEGSIDDVIQEVLALGRSVVALANAEDGIQDIAFAAHADELSGVVQTLLDRAPGHVRAGAVSHWLRRLDASPAISRRAESSATRVTAWDAGQETWFAWFVSARHPILRAEGIAVAAGDSLP